MQKFHILVFICRTQNTNSKGYMHPMFTETLFTRVKIGIQTKCSSMDEWIKKVWCKYIQWDIIQP